MKIILLLADAAQEVNSKLYILGGGWSNIVNPTPPVAVAIQVLVPWADANRRLPWTLRLLDQDGKAVMTPEDAPILIQGELEVGRPPGTDPGSDIDAAMAFTIPPGMPVTSGQRYEWRFEIDGSSESASFRVR